MQDSQYKRYETIRLLFREKKMEQVISTGEPDVMVEIQEKLKEIIVLNKKQREYDGK